MILHHVIRQTLLPCLFLSFSFCIYGQDSVSGVTLCSESNFQGEHIRLSENWNIQNSEEFWPNNIKSIFIPEGWEIWVYRDFDYVGTFRIFKKSWEGTKHIDKSWAGQIKSIRIIRKPSQKAMEIYEPGVTAFKAPYNKGDRISFNEDWTIQKGGDDKWDNKISSIAVPPGMQVVIYEYPGFKGRSKTISQNWTAIGWWDNKISSIKILTE